MDVVVDGPAIAQARAGALGLFDGDDRPASQRLEERAHVGTGLQPFHACLGLSTERASAHPLPGSQLPVQNAGGLSKSGDAISAAVDDEGTKL